MAENSKIEWTRHTWNPWIGCSEVSPACDHCYARDMMQDRYKRAVWGPGQQRVLTSQANWNMPYALDRQAARAGRRDTVFCLSLGDIWDSEVSPAVRRRAFTTMRQTTNLIYLLLSKRIGNAVKLAEAAGGLPPNAALGATMVNQDEWNRDSGKLREAALHLVALFTFASVEPMLGHILIGDWCPDWVICGGESGRDARDMDLAWARSLRDQTEYRGKAFFLKQMTRRAPIPPDLMVRQFPPEVQAA